MPQNFFCGIVLYEGGDSFINYLYLVYETNMSKVC